MTKTQKMWYDSLIGTLDCWDAIYEDSENTILSDGGVIEFGETHLNLENNSFLYEPPDAAIAMWDFIQKACQS